ncbi:tyrosine-type recombinase/integrase [Myxococcus qinghaiensis]|uniref:tyrosine-type recombinase/integrase n=1 Tax=Myxococcus qinghaiensis TaxID=2906758 RepID=UPI0020A8308D|nr:site-specific integrase [Myxococcus qinghaiensis]MCP3167704.1 site-specific integrase [Myxococcus qinghaiensis]
MSVRLRKYNDKNGKPQQLWFVDIKFKHAGGKVERVRKDSPLNTRRGAEQYERDVRAALLMGTFGKEKESVATEETKKVPTVMDFTSRYLTYSDNNNKPSSVDAKQRILKHHILPFFGEMPLDSIGPAVIEDFKALMRKKKSAARGRKKAPTPAAIRKRKGAVPKPLSLKTINNVLAVLGKLLAVAQEQQVIQQAPRVKLFGKVPKPKFDFLSYEEAERLIAASEPEWRPMLLVAIKTGLRQGELLGLQWNDLDLQRGKVHVQRTIWRGVEGLPKGGRERMVDLPASAVEALKGHRHLRGAYVFCQEDGMPFTDGMLKHPLTRALKAASIVREVGLIGWHDLRHTYGSHLAMRGVPLKVIQELMGHATIEMTNRYAHLSPEVKRDAVQLLDTPLLAWGNTGAMAVG